MVRLKFMIASTQLLLRKLLNKYHNCFLLTTLPMYEQVTWHKQCGVTDCGLFTFAYEIDLLLGNDPSNIIYDQSKMRPHLIHCFEKEEITSFPKY